jgi:hypothetical protein
VVAEIDEVPTGERTARLLQAAADHEPTEIDRREAETRDQALGEFDRLGVVPGHEDDAAATIFYGPFIEAFGDDRIERLHDPAARRQASPYLAGSLVAQVGQHEIRAVFAERIRRVDEYPAVPRRQAPQRPRHSARERRAGHSEACGLLDRCRERTVPKFGNLAGKRFWATSAAQDDFMAGR